MRELCPNEEILGFSRFKAADFALRAIARPDPAPPRGLVKSWGRDSLKCTARPHVQNPRDR